MPGRHWVVAYNRLSDEYRMFLWWHELSLTRGYYQLPESERPPYWMEFKYMLSEDRRPDWEQVGLYESKEEAMKAYAQFLRRDKL